MRPLETARLGLRPCAAEDVDRLHALWTEPAVRRYLWDDRSITRAEAQETVDALVQSARESGCGLWIVSEKRSCEPIGFGALRAIGSTVEVELLYGFMPSAWGNGFTTEASQIILEYGFETLGLPRIWSRTDPPNVASLRVIEKLRMRPADNPGSETLPIVAFVLDRPA